MRTELITIPTDTLPLDGAYYEPESREIIGSVLLMHGNCMNFYMGAPRFLPPVLTELGFACLAFNRRGHDVLAIRNSRALEGGAFQTIEQAARDSEIAADWLTQKGHGAPVVMGHSNGGMLAVKYVSDHPDTPALVLLSAHRGGKDIVKLMCENGLWAQDQLVSFIERAEKAVAENRAQELMLLPGWWNVITAESALDFAQNVPDVLQLAGKITCPALFLRGDQEPETVYPAHEFAEKSGGHCDIAVIEECDHFYNNREQAVSARVADWISANYARA